MFRGRTSDFHGYPFGVHGYYDENAVEDLIGAKTSGAGVVGYASPDNTQP